MKKNLDFINKTYSAPKCEFVELVPYMTVCASGNLSKVSEGNAGSDWTD